MHQLPSITPPSLDPASLTALELEQIGGELAALARRPDALSSGGLGGR